MSIDLRGATRRFKPEKRLRQLTPRPRAALVSVADLATVARPNLVPDTNVYIMQAAAKLSPQVAALLSRARLFHCSVCVAELAVGVANADPTRPGWARLRDYYANLFIDLPANRILTPDAQTWTEAGIVAGTLARTQDYQPHQRGDLLNDAAIYLTAAKAGLPVLTANVGDFDLIQQVAPEGRFVCF